MQIVPLVTCLSQLWGRIVRSGPGTRRRVSEAVAGQTTASEPGLALTARAISDTRAPETRNRFVTLASCPNADAGAHSVQHFNRDRLDESQVRLGLNGRVGRRRIIGGRTLSSHSSPKYASVGAPLARESGDVFASVSKARARCGRRFSE